MFSVSAPTASPAARARTPTSAPGSSHARRAAGGALRAAGFTLIELMIVVALIAVAAGVASLALRDPNAMRLDNEAARLAALLESARAESRASGLAVSWAPLPGGTQAQFRFIGLSDPGSLPQRWIDPDVQAEVVGAAAVRLGPEPLIGAQRIVLRLGDKSLVLGTDGLGPFAVIAPDGTP